MCPSCNTPTGAFCSLPTELLLRESQLFSGVRRKPAITFNIWPVDNFSLVLSTACGANSLAFDFERWTFHANQPGKIFPSLQTTYEWRRLDMMGAAATKHALFLLPLPISISIHAASNFQNNSDGGAKMKLRPSSIESGLTSFSSHVEFMSNVTQWHDVTNVRSEFDRILSSKILFSCRRVLADISVSDKF